MRYLLTALFALCIVLPCTAMAADVLDVDPSRYVDRSEESLGYVPDRFIVVLKDNVPVDHARDMQAIIALSDKAGFDDLAQRFQVQRVRPQFVGSDRNVAANSVEGRRIARHYKVHVDPENIEAAVRAYEANPLVDHVERISIHPLYATTNDPYYVDPPGGYPYDQWHYWDTYGIEADLAWDKETGSNTVLVGDLDIGLKWDHGDIGGSDPPGPDDPITNGNVWVNTGEIAGNSIDDDGNGYVDDVIGWDFVERTDWYSYPCIDLDCGGADNDPWDGDGHGTHTAGTIAAITNNGYAVAGVAGGWGDGTYSGGGTGVKIVPCRVGYVLDYWIYGATGVVIMDYVAEAMYYMADLKIAGWNVAAINCSFGNTNDGGLGAAADYLLAQDVMIVAAAGNGNANDPSYLGSRADCLDVGATDQNGNPASFSNYGTWIEVAAPGVEVLSTITDPSNPTSDYVAPLDGTSMSCPHVVGVAALLESYAPSLTGPEKFAIISDPANMKSYNQTKYVGAGIVDARKCLDAAVTCDLTADFSGTPTSGCAPLLVNFTDLSTGTGIDGWNWDFGDGLGTSTQQNPSYTYNSAGTYTVSLTVSSSSQGCDDTQIKTGYITVNPLPVANFSGSPTSGIEPLTVNFTDLSTDATSWNWNFGDGVGTSTEQNPSYTYTSAGTYTVTLTATNACGSDIEQKIDYITVNPCVAPTADFVGSPTTGCAPLTVNFSDQSTNAASWSWDFGDGVGTSTAQSPSYTYTNPGCYTVTLSVTNSCGSDVATKVDYICVDDCGADRSYANADIPVADTVLGDFTYTFASDDVYESITEVEYANHPRKRSSYLEHKWTVNVGAGGSSMMFYVEGYRPANAEGDDFIFAYSTDDATYIDMVTIASATEQVYSYSMPDGLTGTIYIRVVDTDLTWGNIAFDAVYVDEMYIEFSSQPSAPVADFAGSPTSGFVPLQVHFTDLSTGNPTSWDWDFGDGVGTSTEQDPSYTYTSAGVYTVTLTATNSYGSDVETKVDYITVTEPGNDSSHVANIDVGRRKTGPNYRGTCTVIIHDQNNAPLGNATVYVTYDGPNSGSLSGVTAGDGTVLFEGAPIKKPVGEWCFQVTNVTHASHTYDEASNSVTRACESGWVYGTFGKYVDDVTLPTEFNLGQNRPNPFNPTTEISFTLPSVLHVTLDVYNIAGQRVAVLAEGYFGAGEHYVTWNASGVASGVYFYRLATSEYIETKRMILLK